MEKYQDNFENSLSVAFFSNKHLKAQTILTAFMIQSICSQILFLRNIMLLSNIK